jgi:hypothetical protein
MQIGKQSGEHKHGIMSSATMIMEILMNQLFGAGCGYYQAEDQLTGKFQIFTQLMASK